MSKVDFYHLKKQSLEEVLPKLLQKAYAIGKKILLKTTSENQEKLNVFLWTYDDESFLPHGTKKDGFAAEQPIFITDKDDNVNKAEFLFLVNGCECSCEQAMQFERVFNLFDGNDESALIQARRLWKEYKDGGLDVHYWQQTERGGWEQKV